jgi:hypothetical protein
MGATKINFKHVRAIHTLEIPIESFELLKNLRCKILTPKKVDLGDTILVKASFLNACIGQDEFGKPDKDNILYRRRVVPFVSKVKESKVIGKQKRNYIYISIESISEADCRYLYKKMEGQKGKKADMLEIEAKKITFAM